MENHQAKTIRDFLKISCERAGNKNIISVLELDSLKRDYVIRSATGEDFYKQTQELSNAQKISGINNSARVALIAEGSVNWALNFFACFLNGATLCPVDVKLTPAELTSLLEHFGATHALVSDLMWEKLVELKAVAEHRIKLIKFSDFKKFPSALVNSLIADTGTPAQDADLIIYTSGTSSNPKGVVISLSSLFFEAESVNRTIYPADAAQRVVFSILPLNHIYGLSFGLLCTFWSGNEFCMSQSLEPQNIQRMTKEQKVSCFMTIPLFLSLLKNGIETKVRQLSPVKRTLFKLMMSVSLKLQSEFVGRWFFKEVREGVGRHIEFFICGGAVLDEVTLRFFEALGWPIYNGYGLTETGPLISGNTPFKSKRGTVGQVLSGVEVKIQNGEICTKGPHVFKQYLNAEDLTREAFTSDGWFRTGDLGSLDSEGFLSIHGRLKSMIVLSSGKKIQPEEVEDALMASKYVKLACLVAIPSKGVGEKIVAALELHEPYSASISDQKFLDTVTEELKFLCQNLAPFKRPQIYTFRQEPFQVTSSQKVKRHWVQKEIENSLQ